MRSSGCVAVVFLLGASLALAAEDPGHEMVFNDGRRLALPAAGAAEASRGPSTSRPFRPARMDATESLAVGSLASPVPEVRAGLKPLTAGLGQEVVIGWDTRTRNRTLDYPATADVLIESDQGQCSGALIGDDTVATAGHCVHGGPGGDWSTGIIVWAGYDAGNVWGGCLALWTATVTAWVDQGKEDYDYGVVKLNCNIGNNVGWFGFMWQGGSLKNKPATITGYPGDVSPGLTQWQSHNVAAVSQARQLFYQNDTFGGMSGSPIWLDKDGPYLIGIHAYGPHGRAPHSLHNHGTRITKAVFNNLVSWINQ